jgi:transposase
MSTSVALTPAAGVIAVDVGKLVGAVLVTGADRRRLLGPVEFPVTVSGVGGVLSSARTVLPDGLVRVGVEAAGHYHRPLLTGWPAGWEVVTLNPGHVAEQRRVMGRRRVKTDVIDLEAITELLLAGRGTPVSEPPAAVVELAGWAAHRRRRMATRTATKNQLLSQLDRCFPGLTSVLPDVLGTKIGRLVATHFADPRRLAALGVDRFVCFAAARNVRVGRPRAERCVAAAREALPAPAPDAAVARSVLAADLMLLTDLDAQIDHAEAQMAALLPVTPFAPLTTVPGWGTARVGSYGAAVGDPSRWPSHRQLYRASGLSPMQYESAGHRRDGTISREGSVELRRALIDLGIGLWLTEPAARRYAQQLRARGKKGGVIGCAMAHRANKIAYALVRDQTSYQPSRWA